MERKFGFKESRDARDRRVRDEKRAAWDERVSRQNRDKLEHELGALARATFLTPQQKERQRLVRRMLEQMAKKEAEATTKAKGAQDAPDGGQSEERGARHTASDAGRDAYAEIISGNSEGDTHGVTALVPRPLLKQRHTKAEGSTAQRTVSAAAAEERRLLEAMGEDSDDDFDVLLMSL